jgi:hypothetical protein
LDVKLSLEDYMNVIREARTIYVYGVYDDGTPYIILHSDKTFKPRVRSEGFAAIHTKPPLVIIEVMLKQYRVEEEFKIAILPSNKEIKEFLKAIVESDRILLSLACKEDFSEIYKMVAEKGVLIEGDYNAVTFEIPLDNVEELKQLMSVIDIVDKELMNKLEELMTEKQKNEIKDLGIKL